MRERPILFSAPMVRAILAGTKTQTRRVVDTKRQGWDAQQMALASVRLHDSDRLGVQAYFGPEAFGTGPAFFGTRCPYGKPGDRLWVREMWAPGDEMVFGAAKDDSETVLYRADEAALHWDGKAMRTPMDTYAFNWEAVRWKPSIHMPRWASRITLEVTGVRGERLQDISEADARAEGAPSADLASGRECIFPHQGTHRWGFRLLWESINSPDSWAANPWVWVVEFRRIDPSAEG